MPTTLTVVLPVTLEGDAVSVTDSVGEDSNRNTSVRKEHVPTQRIDADKSNNSCNNVTLNLVTENDYSNRRKTSATKKGHEQCSHILCGRNSKGNSQIWNHQLPYGKKQLFQEQNRKRHVPSKHQEGKAPILEMPSAHVTDGHLVVLDKGATRSRASSGTPRKSEQQNNWQQRPPEVGEARLSVSKAYDLDVEHQDIMMKALRSYSHHCQCEGDATTDNANEVMKKSNMIHPDDYSLPVYSVAAPENGHLFNYFNYDEYENTRAAVHNSRFMKMAQCRLRFYDDDINENYTSSLPDNSPLLYALEDGNGVLADAVGHVSRSTKTRPWSVLPGRLCDLTKVDRRGLGLGVERRFQDSTSPNNSTDKRNRPPNRLNASPRSQSAVPLISRAKMAQPIPHSAAYKRRNQTTHMWTDSSQLMSQSVPAASFLHQKYRTSPRSSDAGSERGSPAGKATKTRPSSSYSYDGGFFVGAHSGQAEYFVIHPDWVSEAVTVKKLSIGDKNIGSPFKRSLSFKSRSLPDGRRCLSAPPKQRNPITMDHSESAAKHQ